MQSIQDSAVKLTAQNKMSDLISSNYDLLLLITRFGIPLGFGEKSIGELCKEHHVDANTLLAVIKALANMPHTPSRSLLKEVNVAQLVDYLKRSHSYFLDFRLPMLRQGLLPAISNSPSDVQTVIIKFFDEYVSEVNKHMRYEEKYVFPYVENLLAGKMTGEYRIEIFSKRHDQIELKITELKNILIKYYPAPSGHELNSVLHEIFSCEDDLASHNFIEDELFIPLIEELEQHLLA